MKFSRAAPLALGIVLMLVVNSADFLFRQAYHPVWDSAANGLSVLRAKHFAQLYGPYSRWGFYHPGPALFYVQAFGEWLFHDLLGWGRGPFAGQTLAHAAVMSGFFVAALGTIARWVPSGQRRWWFWCVALALAVPHVTAMNRIPSYDVLRGPSAFLSTWSAHALVLPFLCLLAAGASVAAGRGEDLPTLALASGYLLHLHVAQPMFVLPTFALGYTGLLWQVGRRDGTGGGGQAARSGWRRLPGRAWRAFPRAHTLALAILALFALPVVLDLCRGRESNVARILDHLHRHDTHKSFERACFYFLMFGAYAAYDPLDNEFAAYDRAGFLAFLRAHAGLMALWAAVAVVIVGVLLRGLGRTWRHRTAAWEENGEGFPAWAAGFWLLAVALTLRWNVRQDEQMFYFNSWFTYAIYGFGALIVLAVACGNALGPAAPVGLWRSRVAGAGRGNGPTGRERLAGVLAVLAVAAWHADGLRWRDPDPDATRAMVADLQRLVEATAATPRGDTGEADAVRMLCFEYDVSPAAGATALRLARNGLPFFTVNQWAVYLGEEHAWSRFPEQALRDGRFETWRFAHRPRLPTASPGPPDLPVTTVPYLREFFQAPDDIVVRRPGPPVDPAAAGGAGAVIRFDPDGDAARYAVGGWFTADDGQVWMDDARAVLGFRPTPLVGSDGAVEISLAGLTSVLAETVTPVADVGGGGRVGTRLQAFLDGEPLGAATKLTRPGETLCYRVPAAEWNRRAAAPDHPGRDSHLLIELPDALAAAPPHLPKPPSQRAPIGLALREVRFRWVPPVPGPAPAGAGPQPPLSGSGAPGG